MVNEAGGMGEDLEFGGQPRASTNKVTEEAVRRIQDQGKKAQQVSQQIQKDKKSNTAIAQFLTFLIKTIQNDQIVSLLYEVFFKTKNPETGVTHIRKKINVTVIVGFFYPFYIKEAEKFDVDNLFKHLLSQKGKLDFHEYIEYIKKLASTYHDNIALDQERLLALLGEVIRYFNIHGKNLTTEEYEASIAQIKKELF